MTVCWEVADEALANAGITHITGIIASGNYFVDTPQKVEEVIRLTGLTPWRWKAPPWHRSPPAITCRHW